MIFSLFNRKFLFFYDLVFTNIVISLNNNTSINITKKISDNKESKVNVNFAFLENGEEIESFDYSNILEKEVADSSLKCNSLFLSILDGC